MTVCASRRPGLTLLAAVLTLCACAKEPASEAAPLHDASMRGSGTATLSWEPPRRNVDGSAIGNLAGYFIYYGTNPDNLNRTVKITDPYATTYTVDELSPGTYYFSIVAFTAAGAKSSASPTVSKTIP